MELTIGQRIKQLREARGLTQKDLGEKVGRKQPAIAMLESGETSLAGLVFGAKLAEALGVQVDDLLPEKDEQAQPEPDSTPVL